MSDRDCSAYLGQWLPGTRFRDVASASGPVELDPDDWLAPPAGASVHATALPGGVPSGPRPRHHGARRTHRRSSGRQRRREVDHELRRFKVPIPFATSPSTRRAERGQPADPKACAPPTAHPRARRDRRGSTARASAAVSMWSNVEDSRFIARRIVVVSSGRAHRNLLRPSKLSFCSFVLRIGDRSPSRAFMAAANVPRPIPRPDAPSRRDDAIATRRRPASPPAPGGQRDRASVLPGAHRP